MSDTLETSSVSQMTSGVNAQAHNATSDLAEVEIMDAATVATPTVSPSTSEEVNRALEEATLKAKEAEAKAAEEALAQKAAEEAKKAAEAAARKAAVGSEKGRRGRRRQEGRRGGRCEKGC